MIYLPQIGNNPRVVPRAAENASCLGSAPLKHAKPRRESENGFSNFFKAYRQNIMRRSLDNLSP